MSRRPSMWKTITVLDDEGKPEMKFYLDPMGKLKYKFPRQSPRDILKELQEFQKREPYPMPQLNFVLSDDTDYEEEEECHEIEFPKLVKES